VEVEAAAVVEVEVEAAAEVEVEGAAEVAAGVVLEAAVEVEEVELTTAFTPAAVTNTPPHASQASCSLARLLWQARPSLPRLSGKGASWRLHPIHWRVRSGEG